MNANKILNECNRTDFVTEERYMQVITPIMELAINRNKKYANSIAMMEDRSIIDLIMMKLVRTKQLIKTNESNETIDPKIYDELMDSINYLVYIGIRMNDNNESITATNGIHN